MGRPGQDVKRLVVFLSSGIHVGRYQNEDVAVKRIVAEQFALASTEVRQSCSFNRGHGTRPRTNRYAPTYSYS